MRLNPAATVTLLAIQTACYWHNRQFEETTR